MIYSSLLLLGGLGFKPYQGKRYINNTGNTRVETSPGFSSYWLKRSRKELLRDSRPINPICKAIEDSMYFISRGFTGKSFLF
ncbi:hypothetical protein Mucpa_3536 [Mucilaginibacter paludis DSM 18603]|uniref:Uncharacterized protein n=2 Tax=Mucilaginibacter TaxID=423349 RepID=H1YIT9_9SPHI|nr:hypothetical protein Mucpa_3536 [Mucilaginibacter paludis DSM 18603]